jgi:ATP-dependent Clp protease adaptor protein ClpS
MARAETKTKVSVNHSLQEPPLFRVIYMNDDVTEMNFVATTLVQYFSYNSQTAQNICLDIHNKGSAIVAVLPYEIAEQKRFEVITDARSKNYPLKVTIETDLD